MFRIRVRLPALFVLGAAVLGCGGSGGDAEPFPSGVLSAALSDVVGEPGPPPEPEPPPRPRREIVPDVEVVVNVPAGRLELMRGDSLVRSYPVSVGSARYPTPTGDFLLATVIWNPWWRPPPESDWARNRKPEPPGPGNPMGRVKLHMDELIFIHGTTAEGRLGAPASHGCIRMSNADVIDLAKRLNRYADPDVDEARLDSLSAPGRQERRTVMARSVRMRVVYQVVQARGGRLHVYPDVYGREGAAYDTRVRRELVRAGVDTAQVPAAAMRRLRESGARGGAAFAFAEIPALRPLPPPPPVQRGPRLLGRPVGEVGEVGEADAAPPEPVAEPSAAEGESSET
jgi:hypothetical protein